MRGSALGAEAAGAVAEAGSRTGQLLGRYELLALVGEGGMGEVYRARDPQLGREVAVKLVRSSLKTKELLRRFDNEGRILASLDHPNVARLYDLGTTEDGTPFIVMEYVEGVPVTDYASSRRLPVAERLKLFRKVCAAVHFAHQNLVIHRDIKPGNILVTPAGEPKLLDFGIAKLLDPARATDAPPATATEMRVLTPEYASPEQEEPGGVVTTASDVYSLGVLLYELLTGRRPHRPKGEGHGTERPSAAAALAGAAPEDESAEQSRRRLRGDLDNIVLMALRREPARRYASAAEFSEDVRRHLEGLPVHARKDTFKYRASKFVRRNKTAVAAGALVLLTLIGGVVATSWQAHVARVERARAERRFNEVRRLSHSVLFEYHDAIANLPGSTPVRQKLVDDSLGYLDRLAQEAAGDSSLQQELAVAYLRAGDVQGRFSVANLGDTKGAAESYRKALVIMERLAKADPEDSKAMQVLGACYERSGEAYALKGDTRSAAESYRKAVAVFESLPAGADDVLTRFGSATSHRMLGQVLGVPSAPNLGETADAVEHLRKAAALYESLPAELPDSYRESFQLFGATARYRKLIFLASVYDELAATLEASGDRAGALEYSRRAVGNFEELLAAEPADTELRRSAAVEYGNLAGLLLKSGPSAEAPLLYRKALANYESLAAADPANVNAQKDLAIGYRNMGKAAADAGDTASAIADTRKALDILAAVVTKDQTNAFNRRQLAFTHLRLSVLLADSGEIDGAIKQGLTAVSLCESLVAADPSNTTARNTLALSYTQLGKCHALLASKSRAPSADQLGVWREAKVWYQRSLDTWVTLRAQGKLSGADSGKPDEVAREILKCETASAR
jgi:non-specific serine/threonine protein kinase/serine/threonine-protein kinase